MRRHTIDLLRCPQCAAGSLVSEDSTGASTLNFGPVRCLGCNARFPVSEGLIDCVLERERLSQVQQAMELPWVARSWERYVRPAFDTVITRSKLDRESEHVVTRALLGIPQGAIIDLGCGPGRFVETLCQSFPQCAVLGIDVSRAMLDEALAHIKEHALTADFLRANVPPLPFLDSSIGAISAIALVHFVSDLPRLLSEVARVLKPQGRIVASTYVVKGATKAMHQRLGLFPRDEVEVKDLAQQHGFINFERMRAGPMLVWKAERP